MTDDRLLALARRAVESHRWRWTPGMLRLDGYRVCHRIVPRALNPAEDVPDLTDPATLGCLLALVREVRQEPTGFLVPTHAEGWSYYTRLIAADWYAGDTEVEALVCALEAKL